MSENSDSANSATPMNSLTRLERADPATSDLHHDWKDERPEAGTFAEEALQIHANLLLDEPGVGPFLDTGRFERCREQGRDFLQQPFGPGVEHEPARDHVRLDQRAGLAAN